MEQLTKQDTYKSIKFLNVAIEEIPEIAQALEIEAVPTVSFYQLDLFLYSYLIISFKVICFQNQKAVHRIDGVNIADLTNAVKALAGSPAVENKPLTLDERLKALINKSKIMIFMKGDRNAPRCGFSKQLIQIMNEAAVTYETFDILSDEDVRQGLKTYSDWPTYPQVYVNGELQGGLDIIKEMKTSGELTNVFNA